VVSNAAKKFSEKEFAKNFQKLLEKIDLGINNYGNYPEHFDKRKLKISPYLYIFI
jgi:hypothetical protein